MHYNIEGKYLQVHLSDKGDGNIHIITSEILNLLIFM